MEFSVKELIAISGLIGAALWFLWTQKYKPRMEFDVDCEFFFPADNSHDIIAEIRFSFYNRGFVQHTIKKLELSVHGLKDNASVNVNPDNRNVIFSQAILKRQTVFPQGWYYWVRPNVHQVITKIIKIERKHSVIRVISGFAYRDTKKSRHTAQRVFQLPGSSTS